MKPRRLEGSLHRRRFSERARRKPIMAWLERLSSTSHFEIATLDIIINIQTAALNACNEATIFCCHCYSACLTCAHGHQSPALRISPRMRISSRPEKVVRPWPYQPYRLLRPCFYLSSSSHRNENNHSFFADHLKPPSKKDIVNSFFLQLESLLQEHHSTKLARLLHVHKSSSLAQDHRQ